MRAKTMFKKLGYKKQNIIDSGRSRGEILLITYEYEHYRTDNQSKIIQFDNTSHYIIMCRQIDDQYRHCSITQTELQAINKQVEELGWYKKEE